MCCNSVSSEQTTDFPRVKSAERLCGFILKSTPDAPQAGGCNDSQLVMTPPPQPPIPAGP